MAHQTLARPESDLSAVLSLFIERILAKPVLGTCDYQTPETSWGACDGQPCLESATVHDLATDREYCVGHFREVSRG